MKKERLIAFTDAVLAIIMTILVLELAKPVASNLSAFWDLRNDFFAYALSFFWLGSLWIGLNGIWEKVENISHTVIWWNMILLFFASLIPYATSLVSSDYTSKTMQAFYGLVVILMTVANWILHLVLDKPNKDNAELLATTRVYRKMLLPDIAIKIVGLILALTVYPPIMSYSVLAAAAFILTAKGIHERKTKKSESE